VVRIHPKAVVTPAYKKAMIRDADRTIAQILASLVAKPTLRRQN